ARAQDTDLLVVLLRHALWTAGELVGFLQAEEQGADHALGDWVAQQGDEVAGLHAQRGIDRKLQALIDAAHDRLGRRIDAVGLAGDHGVAADEGLYARRAPDLAARETRGLEALAIPRLHGAAVDRLGAFAGIFRHDLFRGRRHQPGLGLGQKLARGHDFVDQAQTLGGVDREILAFEQDGRRVHDADQARDSLGAAAARQQTDLDLGLADLGPGIGRGDAVMAGEADLEAAAQRGAVD